MTVDSGWWRFWSRGAWSIWWARKGPWREFRHQARSLDTQIAMAETRLISTNTALSAARQNLEWASRIGPQSVPIKTAQGETGLGSVSGVALMEVRRREGNDVWVAVDHGTVYLTDRKARFSGSKDVEFRFDKIANITHTEIGVQIAVSSRKRAHTLAGPGDQIEAMVRGARSFAEGKSPTADYENEVAALSAQVGGIEEQLDQYRAERSLLIAPPRPLSPAWAPATLLTVILVFAAVLASPSPEVEAAVATTTTPRPATTTTAPVTTTNGPTSTTTEPSPSSSLPVDPTLAPLTTGPSGDPTAAAPEGAETAVVASVIDGDTLQVSLGGGAVDGVRLIGLNSPEGNECFAAEAGQALAVLTPPGNEVAMMADVTERDQFDRLLRYVWVGGFSINEELVRRGVAIARRYGPDTAMAERLEEAQEEAKRDQRGLWAPEACGPSSEATVRIGDINYDAPGDDNHNLNEEWVRIANQGAAWVDLTGWTVKDESASHRFSFPAGFGLGPGETVTIQSGCGDDFGTVLFWCSVGSAIWNNTGDTVFLLDPNGNTHDDYAYAPPTTTSTTAPPQQAPTTQPAADDGNCDASYPDVCIPPAPPDLNCGDIRHKRFSVVGSDPHGFDGDNDGVGCES